MSVQSQIDRLNAVKDRIRTNLVAQGIMVPADTLLDEMATLILSVAGYTPQKGIDYWTDADQESIVQQVIAALGTPVFGRVDLDNNIILTGELADGTYTIKYEDGEGNLTEIGTITVAPEPTYTNQIPISVASDGTAYNGGQGWKANTRLNSSGVETTETGIECTGFIPIKQGDIIRFKNIKWNPNSTVATKQYFAVYKADKAKFSSNNSTVFLQSGYTNACEFDTDGNLIKFDTSDSTFDAWTTNGVSFFRISAEEITADSIITINEEIV